MKVLFRIFAASAITWMCLGTQAQDGQGGVPALIEVELLAGHWNAVARETEQLGTERATPLTDLIRAHALYATDHPNEAMCQFAAASDIRRREAWAAWTAGLVDRNRDNAIAQFLSADARARLENWSAAVQGFDEALSLDPQSTLVLNARALAHAALGEWLQARSDLGIASRAAPHDIDVLANQGLLALLGGQDPENAKASFAKVLARSPGHLVAIVGQGAIAATERNWKSATEQYDAAMAANPCIPLGRLAKLVAQDAKYQDLQAEAVALGINDVGTAVIKSRDAAAPPSTYQSRVADMIGTASLADRRADSLQSASNLLSGLATFSNITSGALKVAAGPMFVANPAAGMLTGAGASAWDQVAKTSEKRVDQLQSQIATERAKGLTFSLPDPTKSYGAPFTDSWIPSPGGLATAVPYRSWDRGERPIVLWPVLLYTIKAAPANGDSGG